jgi:hypothetical protein
MEYTCSHDILPVHFAGLPPPLLIPPFRPVYFLCPPYYRSLRPSYLRQSKAELSL